MISSTRLRELLSYNADSGVFVWRRTPRRHGKAVIGQSAGCAGKRGYIYIGVEGKKYQAHRLAWLFVYGEWPKGLIDHINGDSRDNRIANLRVCNHSENMANRSAPASNSSGVKGVAWDRARQKWTARIGVNYKTINLGRFDNLSDAARAYEQAASKHFGQFSRAVSDLQDEYARAG